jgi:Zn ribbon nucleic-acid-binding protein
MDHLRRLGNRITIPIPTDESGFTGRECPNCKGYFKVQFGTGLKGKNLPCHCPYCGHVADHDHFWTEEQIEYAISIAIGDVTKALNKDLKKFEFNHKPRKPFGIGVSLKVKPGRPTPIRYYREKQLEMEVTCSRCTLRYSVYGLFAFCPDCGQHNSLQIFNANLELAGKMLDLAMSASKEVAERLIENALEDCISAFDGFGRELCRMQAEKSTDADKARTLSFQNLSRVRQTLMNLFGIDLADALTSEEWNMVIQAFQKRHLIAHKMGVIDEEYVRKAGDIHAIVGRKISIQEEEVRGLINLLRKLGSCLSQKIQSATEES